MTNQNKQKIKIIFCGSLLAVANLLGGGAARAAESASLYFSPAAGSHAIDKAITVNVYVSSPVQAMNAVTGTVSFPADKLEVTSLSKSGSIISLWVQEPSFSNNSGSVNFEGIVLNPGFTGAAGKVITINFRVKAAGATSVSFVAGSILANDGLGTNILKGLGEANFTLLSGVIEKPSVTETPPLTPKEPPQAREPEIQKPAAESPTTPGTARIETPYIASSTHPDPEKWYANPNPAFNWVLPTNVTAVRLLYDKYPASRPTILYAPPLANRELANIGNGVWYFHAQFRTPAGWGPITHFRFKIDALSPAPFVVTFPEGNDSEEPRPLVQLGVVDELSGIDHYRLSVNGGEPWLVSQEEVRDYPYALPHQTPGRKSLTVTAVDKAGNETEAAAEFTVRAIKSPTITYYPRALAAGDSFQIRGLTYSEAEVSIALTDEKGRTSQETTKSDGQGNFALVWSKPLRTGAYAFSARATNNKGAESQPTEQFPLTVRPAAGRGLSQAAINVLLIFALSLLAVTWLLIRPKGRRLFVRGKKSKKEEGRDGAEHKLFGLLRKNMRRQLRMLKQARARRSLSEEEEKIAAELGKEIKGLEKALRKKV